jgi:hypothetical protein
MHVFGVGGSSGFAGHNAAACFVTVCPGCVVGARDIAVCL